MDQRQKQLISENSGELAANMKFDIISKYLQESKLISEQTVFEITSKVSNEFSRNLKLLNAIIESESYSAFDEFLHIIETTDHQCALKILDPHESSRARFRPNGFGGIFRKLMEKFSPSSKFPLGVNSGACSNHNGFDSSSPASLHSLPSTDASYQTFSPISPKTDELTSSDSVSGGGGDVDIIQEDPLLVWQPYTQPVLENHGQQGSGGTMAYSNPGSHHHQHFCHPFHVPSSGESDASSDSVIINTNLISDPNVTMAIAEGPTKTMKVRKATICHNDTQEDYRMISRPRGPCLIINNIDFEGDIFPTRKGSDEDAKRFDEIFNQLGFQVIMTRNLSADQMRLKFAEVSAACKQEHDALFIFILSHGSEHGIYGTDGIEVYLETEIISCFDNRNCKAMIGKPKVFVIQACRGKSKDCGGDGDALDSIIWPSVASSPLATTRTDGRYIGEVRQQSSYQNNRVPSSWLPSSNPRVDDKKKRKHPIRTDMLIVYSCLAGFVSVRNELAGSWLGVALAYFILTHAHERDLLRILNLVASDVIQRESSHGHIQSIELKLLGWTKNLYFNPGLYADTRC